MKTTSCSLVTMGVSRGVALVYVAVLNLGLTMKAEAEPTLGSNYLCQQLFSEKALNAVSRGRMSRGADAEAPGPRVMLGDLFYAHTQPNGFFAVYDALTEKKIFDSTPTMVKRLTPLMRKSSAQMISVTHRPPPRLLIADAKGNFLVHSTGDLTKLDVWKIPFERAPKRLDLATALIGRKTWTRPLTPGYSDVTSEFGYVERRGGPGHYTSSFTTSEFLNIGATAFVMHPHRTGLLYAMYEVLTDWSGSTVVGNEHEGPYRFQQIVLLEIDLRQLTARRIGEFLGARLADHKNDGEFSVAEHPEANRYTSFTLLMDDDATELQVVGHASSASPAAGTSETLLRYPFLF